jgi:uncharacterized protein involved in exopolysaccharide biosynthesis
MSDSTPPRPRSTPPPPAPIDVPEPERSEDLDLTYVKELAGMILRAPRRHALLALITFVLGLCASAAAALLAPRVYHVETMILAQQNLIMPLLGNPRRPVPAASDAPTQAAREMILQRETLIEIVDEVGLVSTWSEQRPPILKLKDQIVRAISGPVSEEDMRRALVGLLEKRLSVRTDNTSIQIQIDWENPDTAYRIVDSAQRAFLRRRSASEIAVIVDTISILDEESKKQGITLAQALADVQALWENLAPLAASAPAAPASGQAAAQPRRPVAAAPAPAQAPAQPVKNFAALLAEKRAAMRSLDEPRQRRLASLNAKLTELEMIYTPAHPSIVELQARIKQESAEPAEVAQLRKEEQELLASLEAQSSLGVGRLVPRSARAFEAPRASGAPSPPATAGAAAAEGSSRAEREPPELDAARTKLLAAARKYEDLMDRIDAANIELHVTQAAFKYRYTVLVPPEAPRKPQKPRVAMLLVGGVLLSAILALFAAAGRDFTSGRFVEAWQARRRLKIPMLAEVTSPWDPTSRAR